VTAFLARARRALGGEYNGGTPSPSSSYEAALQSGEVAGEVALEIPVVPKREITVVAEPKIDGASAAVR